MFKFVAMVGGAALIGTLASGWVHKVGVTGANAPVAQQVRYYSKGVGKRGQNQHWLTQASEGTQQWQKAKAYCQAAQGSAGQERVQGCGTINELVNSGY